MVRSQTERIKDIVIHGYPQGSAQFVQTLYIFEKEYRRLSENVCFDRLQVKRRIQLLSLVDPVSRILGQADSMVAEKLKRTRI